MSRFRIEFETRKKAGKSFNDCCIIGGDLDGDVGGGGGVVDVVFNTPEIDGDDASDVPSRSFEYYNLFFLLLFRVFLMNVRRRFSIPF